jgi:hypothetical protein
MRAIRAHEGAYGSVEAVRTVVGSFYTYLRLCYCVKRYQVGHRARPLHTPPGTFRSPIHENRTMPTLSSRSDVDGMINIPLLSASVHKFGRGLSDCHCERSEAISHAGTMGLLRRCTPRNDNSGPRRADTEPAEQSNRRHSGACFDPRRPNKAVVGGPPSSGHGPWALERFRCPTLGKRIRGLHSSTNAEGALD